MQFLEGLITPPRQYSVTPFWFWNDDLEETEILRQIADFEAHGVYGFVIHPRVGLPRRLGWMSEALLHFYDVALAEAQRREMIVILYDEGMYPSGSSSGQVVARNPVFQCRGLVRKVLQPGEDFDIPADQELLAVLPQPDGTRWAVIERKIDSVIRGLHYIAEGPAEDEPPAADLLNPEAVQVFIDCVYEQLAKRFGPYFGNTIQGIFTDEPNLLGRPRERGLWPGTRGILEHVERILGYDFTPHLAALWDPDPQTQVWRQEYTRAVNQRLEETWYAPLQTWCREHNLALMGHPAKGDDISHLRYFEVPGQDLVWRWVLPDQPSALEGTESTQGKCSASAMIHLGRRRNSNECYGAYGHELTWEEMLWLANWCFVRGVNWLIPHAFYYSQRGPRRDERPPDVGPNSSWWSRYREYADGCRRLSWLNSECQHLCQVAILGGYNADVPIQLPWRAAKVCFEGQIDFNYLEERHLWDDAVVDEQGVHLAGMHYQALICEHTPGPAARPALDILEQSGRLIWFEEHTPEETLVQALARLVSQDVLVSSCTPGQPATGLRVRHILKQGQHVYLLFNEQKELLDVQVQLPAYLGVAEESVLVYSPYTGDQQSVDLRRPLHFEGHELKVIMGLPQLIKMFVT